MKPVLTYAAALAILFAPALAFANPLPVPEEKQDDLTTTCGSCGSTSTGMALSYLGEKDTPDAVEHWLYDTLPCGPGDDLLANAADAYCAAKLGVSDCGKDFNWSSYDPWELGLAQIEAGRPFVAHTNQYGGHYVLVVGMTNESGTSYVYFNDPAKGARLKWTWSDFQGIWSPKSYRGVRFLIDKPQPPPDPGADAAPAADGGACVPSALQAKAVWALGSTVRDQGAANVIATLKQHNATDLFLMIKGADGTFRFDTLDEAISARNAAGAKVRIHAWVTCFSDEQQGGWVDPTGTTYRKYLIDSVIGPALSDHAIDGLSLDYVRYPGTADGNTAPITAFANEVRAAIDARRPGTLLSAAVMPEGAGNAQAYGQDYGELAGPLDVLLPMTYTYNYASGSEWVKTSTAYVTSKAGGQAETWSTLQSLNDEAVNMPGSRLQIELDAALAGGATGIAMFRYPLSSEQWAVLDSNPIVQCAEPVGQDAGAEAAAMPEASTDAKAAEASTEAPPGTDAGKSHGFATGDDSSGCTCSLGSGTPRTGALALLAALALIALRKQSRDR